MWRSDDEPINVDQIIFRPVPGFCKNPTWHNRCPAPQDIVSRISLPPPDIVDVVLELEFRGMDANDLETLVVVLGRTTC